MEGCKSFQKFFEIKEFDLNRLLIFLFVFLISLVISLSKRLVRKPSGDSYNWLKLARYSVTLRNNPEHK